MTGYLPVIIYLGLIVVFAVVSLGWVYAYKEGILEWK